MINHPWVGAKIVDDLLDQAYLPAARFRLLSSGIVDSHMLPARDGSAGAIACTSCGNCLDACPVVASKPAGAVVDTDSCPRCLCRPRYVLARLHDAQ